MPGDSRTVAQPEALVAALLEALREQASRGVMFHGAVTELVGLGPADVKALDLARDRPELTAGGLAEATGLSTSATTAMLDRLERRGYVRRRRDPVDRRRVIVEATGRHEAELSGLFEEVAARTRRAVADYDAGQLELLLDFVRRTCRLSEEFTGLVGTLRAERDRSGE